MHYNPLIDREDCLIPYTAPNGKEAYLDINSLKPGDFFDPVSKWFALLKPKEREGAMPITWLFFKGDMMQGPTNGHPFEGPWQKVYKTTFRIELMQKNSSVVQEVMVPTDVNDFWETLLQKNWTSQYKLSVNVFRNMDCPVYEFGTATYWWTPPKTIDRKEDYQFRLNASDNYANTSAVFLSSSFKLEDSKIGTPAKIGGSFVVVVLISLMIGGVYFWWQRRQKYKPWILRWRQQQVVA